MPTGAVATMSKPGQTGLARKVRIEDTRKGSTSSYSSQVGSDDPANRSAGSVAGSEDSTTSSGDSTASSYNSTTGCFSPAPKQKKPIVHEHRELVYDPPRGRRLDNQRERYR